MIKLETGELADLGPAQIRVRMLASPINPSDLIPVTGAYSHRIKPPLVAGYEGVGIVVSASPETASLIGQRVLPLRGSGTWQRYVDCDPAWAISVPDDIEDDLASRAYINPLAAFLMTRRWNPVGRKVLVTAASSTCAGLLAQWSSSMGAEEVVGVYQSAEHVPLLRRFGMTPIPADSSAVMAAHAQATDLVFDAVGGELATNVLSAMRPDATFVSYGLLSGKAIFVASGGPRPLRFHIRDHLEGQSSAVWQEWFREIWPLLRSTSLPIPRRFRVDDWKHALAYFNERGRQSKPVLTFDHPK
ncbi:zinc-dependent alcohol dehydrogenase family protein [Agrobacterium cavarae]|uniref:zinc-dependent alcohol dehydrogenase family protein n=1 Tax=Agrobacterium cavarae TaxID=2528239 RepID=UPI0028A05F71|nr:zinc-dependent alcohol dehydrogenase family protein [Agrobacterium cavarae]